MPADIEALIESLPTPALLVDRASGRLVLVNAPACLQLGLEPEGLGRLRLAQLLEEEAELGRIERALLEDGHIAGRETRLRRANGGSLPVRLSGQVLRHETRELLCLSFPGRQQPGAPETVVEAAPGPSGAVATGRRLSDLLMNVSGMAYRCRNDAHWTMEYIRGGCRELTGYEPEELVGNREQSFAELILEEDRALVTEAVEQALRQGDSFELEYRIVARDGRLKWVWEQGRGAPGEPGDDGLPGFVEGIIHDITLRKEAELERAQLEQQLRASQRMEAIGTLAGGIAHDFNNLLTVIQSYASFVRMRFEAGDEGHEDAAEILAATERGARLTRQLLGFGRKQIQELRVLDLNEVVEELASMLARILGEDIGLELELEAGLGNIRADLSQLEQVLMNLCVNARDAMPAGGRLHIETRNVELGQLYGLQHGVELPPGPYILLAVSDNGVGMDRRTQARIFEPFFTTKPSESGTGLGLSTVYGIVKQTKGYIWAYSEPGQGTTFKIYLPSVQEESERARLPAAPDVELQGSGTVLLVEDDIPLRKAAHRILEEHGYEVLEAGSVEEASVILGNGFDRLEAVVTDMVIAGGRGDQVVAQAMRDHPGVGVVMMSGFARGVLAEQAGRMESVALLEKPFSAEELLGKLQEAIAAR